MINKRLKDALFSDQWSELCMDTLSPFGYVLVSMSVVLHIILWHDKILFTWKFVLPLFCLGGIPAHARSAADGFLQILPPSVPPRCADAEYTDRTRRVLGKWHILKSLATSYDMTARYSWGLQEHTEVEYELSSPCRQVHAGVGVCVTFSECWCQHHLLAAAGAVSFFLRSVQLQAVWLSGSEKIITLSLNTDLADALHLSLIFKKKKSMFYIRKAFVHCLHLSCRHF